MYDKSREVASGLKSSLDRDLCKTAIWLSCALHVYTHAGHISRPPYGVVASCFPCTDSSCAIHEICAT